MVRDDDVVDKIILEENLTGFETTLIHIGVGILETLVCKEEGVYDVIVL